MPWTRRWREPCDRGDGAIDSGHGKECERERPGNLVASLVGAPHDSCADHFLPHLAIRRIAIPGPALVLRILPENQRADAEVSDHSHCLGLPRLSWLSYDYRFFGSFCVAAEVHGTAHTAHRSHGAGSICGGAGMPSDMIAYCFPGRMSSSIGIGGLLMMRQLFPLQLPH